MELAAWQLADRAHVAGDAPAGMLRRLELDARANDEGRCLFRQVEKVLLVPLVDDEAEPPHTVVEDNAPAARVHHHHPGKYSVA
jgi:hypothetical protein